VINGKLEKIDGRGGVIGVDKNGNIALVMNTTGMFRAFAKSSGEEGVAVFR
jgi:beta-aspartyl-peptidase (threonine type)